MGIFELFRKPKVRDEADFRTAARKLQRIVDLTLRNTAQHGPNIMEWRVDVLENYINELRSVGRRY